MVKFISIETETKCGTEEAKETPTNATKTNHFKTQKIFRDPTPNNL